MTKFTDLKNAFSSGKLGRKLLGSSDLKEYASGAFELSNFLIYKSRGVYKRPNTYVVTPTELSTRASFGTYIPPQIIPYSSPSAGKDYAISIFDGHTVGTGTFVLYLTEILDYSPTNIINQSHYGRPDGAAKVNGRYTYTQVGDTLILCHTSGTMRPKIFSLDQYSATPSTGSLGAVGETEPINLYGQLPLTALQVPYGKVNRGATTLTPGATSGATTLTSSGLGIFELGHVGSFFKVTIANVTGLFRVTGYVSPTVVNVAVEVGAGGTSASTEWQESAWSDVKGYPTCVTFFQERLVYCGVKSSPSEVFNSRAGDIFHMMQDKLVQDQSRDGTTGEIYELDNSGLAYFGNIESTDAFSFSIASATPLTVNNISSSKSLIVGTTIGECILQGVQDIYGPPNSAVARFQTFHGSSKVIPLPVSSSVFMASTRNDRLREFKYSEDNGSYISRDLTVLNDSILEDKIYQMSWDDELGTAFIVLEDGNNSFATLTQEKDSGVLGWSEHVLSTNGEIHGVIPATTQGLTAICRSINTASGRKIWFEVFEPQDSNIQDNLSDLPSKDLLDSKLFYRVFNTPTPTITISADADIYGDTVEIWGLDITTSPATVLDKAILTRNVSNTFDLPAAYSAPDDVYMWMGKHFSSRLVPMPIEGGSRIGPSQVLIKRIDRVSLRLYASKGGNVGDYNGEKYPIEYPGDEALGEYLDDGSYTGDIIVTDFSSSSSEVSKIEVTQDERYPFAVLNLDLRGQTQE